jgi:hypothetical protein
MEVFGSDGSDLLKPDNVIRFETFRAVKCGFRAPGFPAPAGITTPAEFLVCRPIYSK